MRIEESLKSKVGNRIDFANAIAANKNKNVAEFKLQSQSTRSKRWFDLDFDWIEVNFITREPDLYQIFFRAMKIYKTQIHLKYFKLQLEIQNMWKCLSFTMMNQCSSLS